MPLNTTHPEMAIFVSAVGAEQAAKGEYEPLLPPELQKDVNNDPYEVRCVPVFIPQFFCARFIIVFVRCLFFRSLFSFDQIGYNS